MHFKINNNHGNITEERRNDIYRNYHSALNEEKAGKLKFSSDISHLKHVENTGAKTLSGAGWDGLPDVHQRHTKP
jgi:hypothetical protein